MHQGKHEYGQRNCSNDSMSELQDIVALRKEIGAAKRELETLYAALDNVQSGLLLLDSDLRARYSNPVLHKMFRSFSAEFIREQRPYYKDMLVGAAGADAVEFDNYVERRLAWVRAGDSAPMDITMTNDVVLRCNLAILPGGGRMLIYSDVTDIVQNAREMEKLATIDGMTGIYNRRHFLALADREWERARRYARPLSLLMIDIDFFKMINDRFGHDAGDRAIVHIAHLAASCKRHSDVLARIGGEEFAILLPETERSDSKIIAERLRQKVADSRILTTDHTTTISVGVASADKNVSSISDLMRVADQALYAAKRSGRNKVVCSLPPSVAPAIQEDSDRHAARELKLAKNYVVDASGRTA